MSAIFGIINFDGSPVNPEHVKKMQEALSYWGPDGQYLHIDENAAIGQMQLFNTPESVNEKFPLIHSDLGLAMVAACRIDNREELFHKLDIEPVHYKSVTDAELIFKAYIKWGKECVHNLLGDWSFAVWDKREQKLFLARDHKGITSLYYYQLGSTFVFGSSQHPILALPFFVKDIDEFKLVEIVLRTEKGYETTCFKNIYRLLPAHYIEAKKNYIDKKRYWILEDTPALKVNEAETTEMLHDLFRESVKCRLRSIGKIGCTLSAGFDSMAVTAMAATLLKERNQTLTCYTSVPAYEIGYPVAQVRGNEGFQASDIARIFDNVEHYLIDSKDVSVLDSIRKSVEIYCNPIYAPSNQHWLHDIYSICNKKGVKTLLNGQGGNGTISFPQEYMYKNIKPNLLQFVLNQNKKKFFLRTIVPKWIFKTYKWLRQDIQLLIRNSCLDLNEIERRGFDKYIKSNFYLPESELIKRLEIIKPLGVRGYLLNEFAHSYNVIASDPTEDRRILEICIGISKYNNMSYKTLYTRDIMINILKKYLPETVLNSSFKGIQAADIKKRIFVEQESITEYINKQAISSLIDSNKKKCNFSALNYYDNNTSIIRQFLNVLNIECFIDFSENLK